MLLNVYNRFPVNFVKGEGLTLIDDKGDRYLDFVSGIAVNALGHAHPKMVETIQKQAETLLHVSNLYYNEAQNRAAEKLLTATGYDRVFFCNSGAEANELALKIARKYGKQLSLEKNVILYMKNSFHGRTTGTLAVTGQEKYQADYRPLIPNTVEIEFNNIEALQASFNDNVCAIILEPIQGEGGLTSATAEFIAEIERLAKTHQALVIFDEIQCGMSRTGTVLYSDQLPLKADVVALAKALGGGVPIGACITKGIANEILVPGDHGSTYGGNPFVCSVAATVLDEITSEEMLQHVTNMGQYARKSLEALQKKHPEIIEIRGEGLLLGFKLDDSLQAGDLVKEALARKLLLVSAGGNVVRYFPALIVTEKEIDATIPILDAALSALKEA
ncbi:aspartate aminotransferase family protein [Ignatzschineria cameli]|uniref:Aspartate aminotransferase family protein n=1 Tax=Ignatzschineria cameli TaxID=2182793 RepID=A0ABX5L0R4_9GAMM|nr:aspartate aminotransferase family protein [Ignatzschineria cameli]PWD86090.1 aspartate aminotransferase family protein [Ignatzschineria cameli]PWD88399.1 aspartate aminotransferase family protein [Ignatzschineria cameli]PWD88897.1 aspartate aminotransferase family protein [Ignatzschineria cameli]PWD89614.1 aspartate aminotransferase family protein [Ignatzschineria cameli]